MHTTTPQSSKSESAKAHESLRALLTASMKPVETNKGVEEAISKHSILIKNIFQLEEVTLKVINSQGNCFEVKTTGGRNRIVGNKLGNEILSFLQSDMEAYSECIEHFHINPSAKIFLEEFQRIEPRSLIWFNPNPQKNAQMVCNTLNATVSAIRDKANTIQFRKQIHNFRRSSDKNLASLRRYIDKCFENHSRLLVIRLDLGYKKEAFIGNTFLESLNEVQEHWRKWIRRFKDNTGKAFIGYAKKLEFGIEKSFHFHVLLLLDGSRTRQDGVIALLGGNDWNKGVTQGKGIYFNCNAHKDRYQHLGIGMVHASDQDKRSALDRIANYFIKTDYFIKLVVPDGSRVFSKGDMPRAKLKPGRPRKTSTF